MHHADDLKRNLVVLACAISAGIHGALVPDHLAQGAGPGLGFVAATVVLAASAVAVTMRPGSAFALASAAAICGGLLTSYALATTVGLPLLHPEREPVGGLALATKVIEAAGLLAAASLIRRPPVAATSPQPKGT